MFTFGKRRRYFQNRTYKMNGSDTFSGDQRWSSKSYSNGVSPSARITEKQVQRRQCWCRSAFGQEGGASSCDGAVRAAGRRGRFTKGRLPLCSGFGTLIWFSCEAGGPQDRESCSPPPKTCSSGTRACLTSGCVWKPVTATSTIVIRTTRGSLGSCSVC